MYIIHSRPGCSWCDRAVELLNLHKIDCQKQDHDTPEKIAQFKAKGFSTFPQIYNEKGQHIGGFEDLELYLAEDDF